MSERKSRVLKYSIFFLPVDKVGYHNLARSINDEYINLYADSPERCINELPYIGCGESKLCMGYPDGCVATKSCDYAAAIANDNVRNMFSFHIIGKKAPGYVAIGLYDDRLMVNNLFRYLQNYKYPFNEQINWYFI